MTIWMILYDILLFAACLFSACVLVDMLLKLEAKKTMALLLIGLLAFTLNDFARKGLELGY